MFDKIQMILMMKTSISNNRVSRLNDAFNSFYKTPTEILDHHAPLIKITKKEGTLQLKHCINKEIQYLMWKRDKLFRKYCACA